MAVDYLFSVNNKLIVTNYPISWLRNALLCSGRKKIQDHNDPVLSRMHGSSLYLYTSLSRSSIKLKEERCLCNQLTKSGSRPTWGVCV